MYESRHRHALNRQRGLGGVFVKGGKEDLEMQARGNSHMADDNISAPIRCRTPIAIAPQPSTPTNTLSQLTSSLLPQSLTTSLGNVMTNISLSQQLGQQLSQQLVTPAQISTTLAHITTNGDAGLDHHQASSNDILSSLTT